MKLGELLAELSKMPHDAPIEIGKFLAVNGDDAYEVRLDMPMAGFGFDPETGEIVFIVSVDQKNLPWLLKFGTVEKMSPAESLAES
jgi:hypothetical protein